MADSGSARERATGQGRLYRTFVSVETSLVFLGVFALFFFLAAIFPQGSEPDRHERYREAGGKFVTLVESFDLLNLFHTWYFALVLYLFILHMLLCSLHRLNVLRKRPSFRPFTREELLRRDYSFSILRPAAGSAIDIEKTLKGLGYRRPRYYSEDARVKRLVCERGIRFRWMSLIYHACILITIGGLCVTHLLAFEGRESIAVGERKMVVLDAHTTEWQKLARLLGISQKAESEKIGIELERFITKHVQKPSLQYPNEPSRRLLAAWGLGDEAIRYKMAGDTIHLHDWFSTLNIYENGNLVRRQKIEVNDPLRYAGITFYQIGHRYEMDLEVGDETFRGIVAETPFTIPQMEGEFRLRTPKLGTLYKYDGTVQVLAPSAKLEHRPPIGRGERIWTTVARMVAGKPTEVMHAHMTIADIRGSSVLGYRRGPGGPLLWISTTVLVVMMALRLYLSWYQIRCHADDSTGRTLVTISIRMVGLFASPEREKQRLCDALQK